MHAAGQVAALTVLLMPSVCTLQNYRACRDAVMEAAQLYKDENDDEKVQAS
jgi:hypothetical protein